MATKGTTVGGMEMTLAHAKEDFDELPELGDTMDVNGREHFIVGITFSQDEMTEELKVVFKLEPKREVRVVGRYKTEEEIREAAGHLLG